VYCSKCGSEVAPGTTFCGSCGTPVGKPAAITPAVTGVPVYTGVVAPATAPGVSYAGFWLRFVAHLIDGIIIGIAILGILVPLVIVTGLWAHLESLPQRRGGGELNPAVLAALITLMLTCIGVGILLQWLYFAYLESGDKQATWGKQALGIYVTDLQGRRLTFGRASGRFFAKIISGLIPLAIGYIMAGFTERKQALHDMIAGCLVLRR
jgi:uncharacterized RDD family membrane protein YckC